MPETLIGYIAPNSTIRFHQNVALDNTYDHTYWFPTRQDQTDFFSSVNRIYLQLDSYSYQRHSANAIRVALPISRIVNCSYMSFKNTYFEGKWFYAFVTDLEYVNNNTTIVYYEIDVIQTYFYDITFKQCFIDRQHTTTDNIGDNTVPEPINVGEYMYNNAVASDNHVGTVVNGVDGIYSDYVIVIAATVKGSYDDTTQHWAFTPVYGVVQGGVYGGIFFNIFNFNENGMNGANSFLSDISEIAHMPEAVISVFMAPMYFVYNGINTSTFNPNPKSKETRIAKNYSWTYLKNGVAQSVRNKKLFTYPFNLLHVSNGNETVDYKFELFYNDDCRLENMGVIMPTSEIDLIPINYKMNPQETSFVFENFNEKISITNLPQCPFNIDGYKAWYAMNATPLKFNTEMGVISGLANIASVAGGVSTNPANDAITGTTKMVDSIGNSLIQFKLASTIPPQPNGSATNVLAVGSKQLGFHIYYARVKDEYAAIIDDYFTRYGYAIHKNGVPNFHARSRFTYIKTVDCTIDGNLPNEYSRKFVNILNNGITFWADYSTLGDYTTPNSLLD